MNYAIIYTRVAADQQHVDHWQQEQQCRRLLWAPDWHDDATVVVREVNTTPDMGESGLALAKGMILDGGVGALAETDLGLLTGDADEVLELLATVSEHRGRLVTADRKFGANLQPVEAIWKTLQAQTRGEPGAAESARSPVAVRSSSPLSPLQPATPWWCSA